MKKLLAHGARRCIIEHKINHMQLNFSNIYYNQCLLMIVFMKTFAHFGLCREGTWAGEKAMAFYFLFSPWISTVLVHRLFFFSVLRFCVSCESDVA